MADLPKPENLQATAIYNYNHPNFKTLIRSLRTAKNGDQQAYIKEAYDFIQAHTRPVYTLQDSQPASTTLEKGQGSCMQRTACLEALARAKGIATRVRALWIKRQFWRYRFPVLHHFLPKRVLIAWPQFHINNQWKDFDALFAEPAEMMATATHGFRRGTESLFDAVSTLPVDFYGKTQSCGLLCNGKELDLSRFVAEYGPLFDSRDAMYAQLRPPGKTLRGWLFEKTLSGSSKLF